ncbi:tetratricopeptide (TPR) repeat protein [Elusimicrobium simillimum]|uniref:tetratricopeptide repeat protein n=1 Tax=Elusimicrobium simillimum TaxID=3143438 RepID=UPI003C6F32BA
MRKFLTALMLVLLTAPAMADSQEKDKHLDDVLKYGGEGITAVYNLDFKTARKNIDIAFEKYPNHPYAHFGNMLVEWGRFEYEFEKSNPQQKKVFEAVLQDSITGISSWLKTHPDDPMAFMALGGAYGLRGLFAMDNKSWVTAYFSARKGVSYMKKAVAVDPDFYDAYFGLGMFEYYTGTLPSVVKILAKIVAMKGDPQKGVDYLNTSREKGMFTKDASKLLLVEIYNSRISAFYNPQEALGYIREVAKKYPANPLMGFVEIIVQYENKNYDTVIVLARKFLNNIGKKPFFTEMYVPRSYTAIGTAQMAKGQWNEALKTLLKAKEVSFDGKEPSRWAVWNLLRLGQTYDALGQRKEAEAIYKLILRQHDTWDINGEAKKYLKTPFTKDTELGPLPPL